MCPVANWSPLIDVLACQSKSIQSQIESRVIYDNQNLRCFQCIMVNMDVQYTQKLLESNFIECKLVIQLLSEKSILKE